MLRSGDGEYFNQIYLKYILFFVFYIFWYKKKNIVPILFSIYMFKVF